MNEKSHRISREEKTQEFGATGAEKEITVWRTVGTTNIVQNVTRKDILIKNATQAKRETGRNQE